MAQRDRRHEIMQAAERLFTGRRLHEITLDDVVKEAKVGKGTIYRYFDNKDDLFFQVATSGFEELCELLGRKVPSEEKFEAQLLGACRQIVAFFDKRRQLFRMMQSEDARMLFCKGGMRDRWIAQRRNLALSVARIFEHGAAEGVIRKDISPEILASYLLALLRTRSHRLSDVPETKRSLELLVDLFCKGAGGSGKKRTARRAK